MPGIFNAISKEALSRDCLFLSFARKRNAKGTPKERAMNLGIIEWKTGGRADMTAQQV